MKKLLKTLIFTAFSLISVLAFIGCKNNNENSSNKNVSISENLSESEFNSDLESNVEEIQPQQLAAPKNLYVENNVAYWDAVENAIGYWIDIKVVGSDEEYMYLIEQTSYNLKSIAQIGKVYEISVFAEGERRKYLSSETTKIIYETESTATFEYEEIADGQEYRISKVLSVDSILIFPDTYEGKPITEIDNRAFYEIDKTLVTKIVFPAYLKALSISPVSVSGRNFTNLIQVDLPQGLEDINAQTFANCNKLARVNFPDGLKIIGASAFENCALTEITIPNSVTYIGATAFSGCTKLIKISGGAGLQTVELNVFKDTAWYNLQPDGFVFFGKAILEYKGETPEIIGLEEFPSDYILANGVFIDCKKLIKISLPNHIAKIPKNAFTRCTALTEITLPNTLKEIGEAAFLNCKSLNNIMLPDDIEIIKKNTFNRCEGLVDIQLSKNLKMIEASAFRGCINLKNIVLPDNVVGLDDEVFKSCTNLENIFGGTNVTAIGKEVFENTAWYNSQPDGLMYFRNILLGYKGEMPENMVLDNITDVFGFANSVFAKCTNLTEIVIPKTVKTIPLLAFSRCASLERVYLPKGVADIKGSAFYNCTALKEIYFEGTKEEWETIQIVENGNDVLKNVTVIFEYSMDVDEQ